MSRKRGRSALAVAATAMTPVMMMMTAAPSTAVAQAQFLREAQYLWPVGPWFLPFPFFVIPPGLRTIPTISTSSRASGLASTVYYCVPDEPRAMAPHRLSNR